MNDGIRGMLPRASMCESARRLRDTYEIRPGAPLVMREFGYYSLDRWRADGDLPEDADDGACIRLIAQRFGYDEPGSVRVGGMGWCEAPFVPVFETKVLEDRGEHELVQDFAGRKVLHFKGRRSGYMPEYVDHPVKDMKSWKALCLWRLDPGAPDRFRDFSAVMDRVEEGAKQGKIVQACLTGGCMYLRSLMGPVDVLYAYHDAPDLIHACMEAWFRVCDETLRRAQLRVTVDEIYFAEDICYNKGPLISPAYMREFLFPYYRRLIANLRKRQLDPERHLFVDIDTDGDCRSVIPIYRDEIGMDFMNPFEVSSGCDVVELGRQHPWLIMSGGIDKRVLAVGGETMERYLRSILGPMRERGGYIPTCDHGVPAEVSFRDFARYREILLEYAR